MMPFFASRSLICRTLLHNPAYDNLASRCSVLWGDNPTEEYGDEKNVPSRRCALPERGLFCDRYLNQAERKGSFRDGFKSQVLGALGGNRWRDCHANGRRFQPTTLL